MIEVVALLMMFPPCNKVICGSPSAVETYSSNIECNREMNKRIEKDHGTYTCLLARRWVEPIDPDMPRIVEPFRKAD